MKTLVLFLLTLTFLISCSSGPNQQQRKISSLSRNVEAFSELYSLLNTPEKPLSSQRSILKYEKVIGGLTCLRSSYQFKDDQYQCSLENESVSHRAIYNSLGIEEMVLPSNRLTLKYLKRLAGISCSKINILGQSSKYHCILLNSDAQKCVSFQETCKASFCTGGYRMIDEYSSRVIEQFRYFDYGANAKEYCQNFLIKP